MTADTKVDEAVDTSAADQEWWAMEVPCSVKKCDRIAQWRARWSCGCVSIYCTPCMREDKRWMAEGISNGAEFTCNTCQIIIEPHITWTRL